MQRTVFVSGAAGGLGRATTEYLTTRGWHVIAGDLQGERLDELGQRQRVTPVAVDVTDADSVARVAEQVPPEGLDAVVTFAGTLVVGSVAEVPEEDFQRILDVNLLGTYRVVKALFDAVVARQGRIVLVSSETGWQTAAPFNGPYATSKHAVEAYADALRREAALLGVRVVKLQPGPFRTDMVGGIETAIDRAAEASTHFEPLLRRLGALAARESEKASDPAVLAHVVEKALTAERPPPAYSVRPDLARSLLEVLPMRAADALVVAALRRFGGNR